MVVSSLSKKIVKKRLKKVKRPRILRNFTPKAWRKARMGYHSSRKSVQRSRSGPQTEPQMLAQIETKKAQIQDIESEILILQRERQELVEKIELQNKFFSEILKEKEKLEEKFKVLQAVVGLRLQAQEQEAEKEEWKKKYTDMVEFAREFVSCFEKANEAVSADSSFCLPTGIREFMEFCGRFVTELRVCLES
ncbi:uncharacterized protein LOC133292905 [Gastrolobium bilobum]|uniref:uncharacterized protein LOC133292905 n=1 Tax=Gastrolobium bilobum TaxID=150636 RepID=UPI002AAFF166|nr:uncharacterized protein LOC133292905 [Gastrolobium bilobum]